MRSVGVVFVVASYWWSRNCRETAAAYGFQEYDCPILEVGWRRVLEVVRCASGGNLRGHAVCAQSVELYERKAGEEITQQMYNFEDKAGERITLRCGLWLWP